MTDIVAIPKYMTEEGDKFQKAISELNVTDDQSACIMAITTRAAVTLVAEMKDMLETRISIAYQEHKMLTRERGLLIQSADGAAAEGRLKIEQWANEQYGLAKEAAENGDIPTRLFPDMDGVTLTPKLVPTVTNAEEFFSWCIDTGNMHLIKVDEAKFKKYVNSAGTQARSIPGADVKVQYSATIRKNK